MKDHVHSRGKYVKDRSCEGCREENRKWQQAWRDRRLDAGWRISHGRWIRPRDAAA